MAVCWKDENGNTCFGVNPETKKRRTRKAAKKEPEKDTEKEPETAKKEA